MSLARKEIITVTPRPRTLGWMARDLSREQGERVREALRQMRGQLVANRDGKAHGVHAEMGRILGFKGQAITQLLSEPPKNNPSYRMAEALAEYYGVDPAEILGGRLPTLAPKSLGDRSKK